MGLDVKQLSGIEREGHPRVHKSTLLRQWTRDRFAWTAYRSIADGEGVGLDLIDGSYKALESSVKVGKGSDRIRLEVEFVSVALLNDQTKLWDQRVTRQGAGSSDLTLFDASYIEVVTEADKLLYLGVLVQSETRWIANLGDLRRIWALKHHYIELIGPVEERSIRFL